MPDEIEIQDGATDLADPRNYPHDEVFESGGAELPRRVFHARAAILNQGRTMECTIFSATRAANEVNGIERENIGVPYADTTTTEEVKPHCYKYGYNDRGGGPITGPLDALRKDMGILAGYTTVKREIGALKSVLVKNPICSGSNKIPWHLLSSSAFIVIQLIAGSPGHAFEIVGYDDDFVTPLGVGAFIVANSYGTEYGRDGGYFYIPYEIMVAATYSWHNPIDVSNASPLYRYKSAIKGIWNGERGDDNVSRYEASLMAQRTRPAYAGNIWNGKEPDAPVLRQDFVTMLSRVVGSKVEWSGERGLDAMARGEAAELCGKYI